MVALGSRGDAPELDFPLEPTATLAGIEAAVGAGLTSPAPSFGAFASADGGPPTPPEGPTPPPSSSGPVAGGPVAGGPVAGGPVAGGPVAGGPPPSSSGGKSDRPAADGSARANPWERDSGTFGGFGLSGRNGRFLSGGRPTSERPGINGRVPEVNGRAGNSASAQLGERDTGDHPAPAPPDFRGGASSSPPIVPGPAPAEPETTAASHPDAARAHPDDFTDENGRDEMTGRAGAPGYSTGGETEPDAGRRRDLGDATDDAQPRRQATGWASVPTSTNPVVPTSGAPTSGAPSTSTSASASASASAEGQAPPFPGGAYGSSYPQDPISGVPAPRMPGLPGQVSPPAFPSTFPPPQGFTPGGFPPAPGAEPGQAVGSAAVPSPSAGPAAPVSPPETSAEPSADRTPSTRPVSGPPIEKDTDLSTDSDLGSRTGLGTAPVSPAGLTPATDPAPSLSSPPAQGSADELGLGGRAATADLAASGRATVNDTGDDRFGRPAASAGLLPADEGVALGGRRSWDDDSPVRSTLASSTPAPSTPASSTPAQRRSASLEDAEPVRRGRRAAPDDDDAPDESAKRPGDVAAGQIAFWDDDATRHFREAWHEVKAEFVDDPVTALTRAHDLLTDAVNELTEALLAERDELDPLRSTSTPDTESMRMAMRGYREFLDRILAL